MQDASTPKAASVASEPLLPEPAKAVKPEPIVTSNDDHSDSFFDAEVHDDIDESAEKPAMLADDDPVFAKSQADNNGEDMDQEDDQEDTEDDEE